MTRSACCCASCLCRPGLLDSSQRVRPWNNESTMEDTPSAQALRAPPAPILCTGYLLSEPDQGPRSLNTTYTPLHTHTSCTEQPQTHFCNAGTGTPLSNCQKSAHANGPLHCSFHMQKQTPCSMNRISHQAKPTKPTTPSQTAAVTASQLRR